MPETHKFPMPTVSSDLTTSGRDNLSSVKSSAFKWARGFSPFDATACVIRDGVDGLLVDSASSSRRD
jgi:hypothetical protein